MADNINGTLSQSGQMRASLSLEETQLRAQMSDANPSLNAALEQSREFVVPTNFGDLGDVQLTDVQDGQVPKYNSETGKWENANDEAGSDAVWGNIRGTLSDQTDLQNALNSKQDTLVFDNTPTAGSNNPVKSSGIKSALDEKIPISQKGAANGVAILDSDGKVPSSQLPSISAGVTEEELRDTVGWTGKNLLENKDFITTIKSGVTFLPSNGNSYYALSGTALADIYQPLIDNQHPFILSEGDYVFSGGISANVLIYLVNNATGNTIVESRGSETSFSLNADTAVRLSIYVKNGTNTDNITIYPMIRKASISDPTYEPYHSSVKQVLRDGEVIEGKNLYNKANYVNGYINSANNTYEANTGISFICKVPKNTDVTVTGTNGNRSWVGFYDGDFSDLVSGKALNRVAEHSMPFTVNTYDNTVLVYYINNTVDTVLAENFMVCYATETDPTFEPYYIPLKDSKFDRSEQRVLGAKNLLPNNASTQTINGVTFTVNADGSVTANGTASADIAFNILDHSENILKADTPYILSGCPSGGTSSTYMLGMRYQTYDYGSGSDCIFTSSQLSNAIWTTIFVKSGVTVSNLIFKPMLRLASDPDNTYVPYAMTNKELTDIVKNVPQEIVRTGVTATAGTAVRIPASGTDSRISTANTCVVKPLSEVKSDGTPYKYRTCMVYSGYVEITYAENISNIAVGVEVVNY